MNDNDFIDLITNITSPLQEIDFQSKMVVLKEGWSIKKQSEQSVNQTFMILVAFRDFIAKNANTPGFNDLSQQEQVNLFLGQSQSQPPITKTVKIFLIAGQSNATGEWNSGYDSTLDANNDENIKMLIGSTIIQATASLTNPQGAGVGFALHFAKRYRLYDPDSVILLVPTAVGGTGYSNNRWRVGDDLYLNAISQANLAISLSGGTIKGILWLQGETDALNSMSGSTYQSYFDAMIAGMRAGITGGNTASLLVMSMMPEFITAQGATATAIDNIHKATETRISNSRFVRGINGQQFDTYHYTVAGQRINGYRYAESYIDLISGIPEQAVFTVEQGLSLSGNIVDSWKGSSNNVFAQNNSLSKPTLVANQIGGKGVVDFNGAQSLLSDNIVNSASYTKSILVKIRNTTDYPNLLSSTTIGSGTHYFFAQAFSSDYTLLFGYDSSFFALQQAGVARNQYKLLTITFNAGTLKMFVNGIKVQEMTGITNSSDAQVQLGYLANASNFLDGQVAWIGISNKTFSESEVLLQQQRLTSYYGSY